MQSKVKTVREYIASLPKERREAVETVRKVILKNLPKGYEEGMQYGMIGYFVPLKTFPEGYLKNPKQPLPFIALASQKNYMAVYMMHIYSDPKLLKWFLDEYKKSGKKLDMGKSCIRFKKLENLPTFLIGKAVGKMPVKKWISIYKKSREDGPKRPSN